MSLVGDGRGSVIDFSEVSDGKHAITLGQNEGRGNAYFRVENIRFWEIDNLGKGKAIYLHNANTARINNCIFNGGLLAVEMTDSFAVRFQNTVFQNQSNYGLISTTSAHHTTFNNCNFYNIAQETGHGGSIVFLDFCDNIVIRDCDFENCRSPIAAAGGSSFVIDGCYIEWSKGAVFSTSTLLRGLSIRNSWISSNDPWQIANVDGGELTMCKVNDQIISFDYSSVRNFDRGNIFLVSSSIEKTPINPVTLQNGWSGRMLDLVSPMMAFADCMDLYHQERSHQLHLICPLMLDQV